MTVLTPRRTRFILSLLGLALFVAGCNDDDDSGVPADISGVWQGEYVEGNETGAATVWITQTGNAIEGIWESHEGAERGAFKGTYENGVATVVVPRYGEINIFFSGNSASATADGASLTLRRA